LAFGRWYPAIGLRTAIAVFCVFFGENVTERRSTRAHLIGSRRITVEY
jgi:hypothetical protein